MYLEAGFYLSNSLNVTLNLKEKCTLRYEFFFMIVTPVVVLKIVKRGGWCVIWGPVSWLCFTMSFCLKYLAKPGTHSLLMKKQHVIVVFKNDNNSRSGQIYMKHVS